MSVDTVTRLRFSLSALFGAVIATGLIFGALSNIETSYLVTIRCQTLPTDDHQLANWFEGLDGVRDVSVCRDGETINVEFKRRYGSFELFAPPLAELGYTGLEEMEMNILKPSLIGGTLIWVSKVPVVGWFAIAAIFTVLLARQSASSSLTAGQKSPEKQKVR